MPKRAKDDPSPSYQRKDPEPGDGRYAAGEVIKDGYRLCNHCKTWKPFDCYAKNKNCVMGLSAVCRDCINEKARIRYTNKDILSRRKEQKSAYDKARRERLKAEGNLKPTDAGVLRARMLKRNYGMTPEDYDSMVETQNNECLICFTSGDQERNKRLLVDHCHASGKVRGLLCNKCNLLLGHADDTIDRLERAILYLKERGEG
jgi:hypothetical protein